MFDNTHIRHSGQITPGLRTSHPCRDFFPASVSFSLSSPEQRPCGSRQNTRSQAAEPHEQGVVFPQISDIHFHPCAGQALAVRIFTLRMQAKALLPISLQKPSLGPPAAALAPPSMESCPYADTTPHRCRCSDWTLPRT
jgi:hypothetical protein